MKPLLLAFFFAALITCPLSLAAPPKVTNATPDNADIGIDPALTELRITFDQDMSPSGHSLCGGGSTFPKLDGDPTWLDARTLTIPVKLGPGRTYALSINCPAATNFRNRAGEPADPYPLAFTTRKPSDPAPTLSPNQAKASAAALRKAIDEQYSYRDLRKLNWDALFKENTPALEAATTPSQFARAAAALLASAKDIHITVRIGDFFLPAHRSGARPNGDFKSLPRSVKNWFPTGSHAFTGEYEGTPYLLLADWTGTLKDYQPVFDFLKQHTDAPAIIIDARFNSGGDELLARAIAGCFVAAPTVYSKNKTRDPSAKSGWTDVMDRVIAANPDQPRFKGRVVVLMGRYCMSSNESFLLMLRHGAAATLIGEPSYGSSGNPRPTDLGNGVCVLLPTWIDMEPDGHALEGVGIQPTIPIKWKLEHPDPLLVEAERALKAN